MPLLNNKLFDVPIYRDSPREYDEYLNINNDKYISFLLSNAKAHSKSHYDFVRKQIKENPYPINPQGIEWRYNRIIGWIEFYFDGTVIKANLYFTRSKRIRKNLGKQIIDYKYKIEDVSFTNHKTNPEIINDIESFLRRLQSGELDERFKKFHIDSDDILNILRYTDIKSILSDTIASNKNLQE